MTQLQQHEVGRTRAYPPRVSEFTRPFWQALREGRWTTTSCSACGKLTFPPKAVCPHCWSADMTWREWSHRGVLYSWTRIHAAPSSFESETPYAVGIVDLDDGVRIACRLFDEGNGAIQIGNRVEIVAMHYQDGPLFAARITDPAQT